MLDSQIRHGYTGVPTDNQFYHEVTTQPGFCVLYDVMQESPGLIGLLLYLIERSSNVTHCIDKTHQNLLISSVTGR